MQGRIAYCTQPIIYTENYRNVHSCAKNAHEAFYSA